MSQLTIYADAAPGDPLFSSADPADITRALAEAGIRWARWEVVALPNGASSDEILSAYAAEIDRLKRQGGYVTVDVARMAPDHPAREAIRQKFFAEHTHSEDEVRFFVEGAGLFCFHLHGRVYQLLAEAGDLVNVPAGTPHWFDAGAAPSFAAIRLFVDPAGWVAHYTGSPIATQFPAYTP